MSSQKLIANGGGNTVRNRPMFELGIDLSGAEHPNILVVPSAKSTEVSFNKAVDTYEKLFGELMGVKYELLHDFVGGPNPEQPDHARMQDLINGADYIHITGGNTPHQRKVWLANHIDSLVTDAATNGTPISGVSSGAIALFSEGLADPSKKADQMPGKWKDLILVDGTGLIDGVVCPHYHDQKEGMPKQRRDAFLDMSESLDASVLVGIDSYASLVVIDGIASVVKPEGPANAYVITNDNGEVIESVIEDGTSL